MTEAAALNKPAPPSLEAFTVEARGRDAAPKALPFRDRFHIPKDAHGDDVCYFVGNSLGLLPRTTRAAVLQELDAWGRLGVEGHFSKDGPLEPWFSYHDLFKQRGAALVGAVPGEVVAMNSLTVNLHLLMVSFYRPTRARFKIVIEAGAFPSDRYAVMSQAQLHGFDPATAVVELSPRPGEDTLRTDDVCAALTEHGHEVAMVLLGGVHYYTGQLHDVRAITAAARAQGIVVGWDLAHAAGNAPLRLHDDGVDFAAWCSYKYLNSGPGSVGLAFVHERHHRSFELPRLWGWWGNDPKTRFQMGPGYQPQAGAAGWQISNAPVLSMAALHASLELFHEATMPALRARSVELTAFLERAIDEVTRLHPGQVHNITPREPAARGAQLSLRVKDPEATAQALMARGVWADVRRPDVVRVAPVPLYNTFGDCARFAIALADVFAST